MLIKDGQEINPDQEEEEEEETKEVEEVEEGELSDEELAAIVEVYRREHARPRPQRAQYDQKPQRPKPSQPDNGYGEYKFVRDDDDRTSPLKETLSKIPVKAIVIGLIILVLLLAAWNGWKKSGASSEASGAACEAVETTVVSVSDQTDSQGTNYCLVTMNDGTTTTTFGACTESIWSVGSAATHCK